MEYKERSLADIGLIQQDALNRIGALGRVGEQERAMRQAGLDIGYDDFVRQRDFDRDQIDSLVMYYKVFLLNQTKQYQHFKDNPD